MIFKKRKTNSPPPGMPWSGEACFVPGSSNLEDYLCGGFLQNPERDFIAEKTLSDLIKIYGKPHCGSNRATFLRKNTVLKFPLNDAGEDNNQDEASFISPITARSRSIIIDGFLCCLQEKLDVFNQDMISQNYEAMISFLNTPIPDWSTLIDTQQIGKTKQGIIKAYDFGDDIEKIKRFLDTKNIPWFSRSRNWTKL